MGSDGTDLGSEVLCDPFSSHFWGKNAHFWFTSPEFNVSLPLGPLRPDPIDFCTDLWGLLGFFWGQTGQIWGRSSSLTPLGPHFWGKNAHFWFISPPFRPFSSIVSRLPLGPLHFNLIDVWGFLGSLGSFGVGFGADPKSTLFLG